MKHKQFSFKQNLLLDWGFVDVSPIHFINLKQYTMIYTYNENELRFKQIKLASYFKVLFIFFMINSMTAAYFYNMGLSTRQEPITITEIETVTVVSTAPTFSQERMVVLMNELNIKYPWIPMAQSMIETGYFKSDIFIENNNLFGMKEARVRIHTADGTNKSHAFYSDWKESVYDYAFYQATYLHNVDTESDYFAYLGRSYAEDKNYTRKIMSIIDKYNLKEMFGS